jgi:hypothetical protein
LRLNKKTIVPIAVVALMAAGVTAVAANPNKRGDHDGQQRANARHHQESESARRHRVSPPVSPPVGETTPPVDVTTPPVDVTTPPVDVTTPPIDVTTPPISTTTVPAGSAQSPVNLGTAGSFAVLSKSGITDVAASAITGNVGASPITGAAIGLTCPEVTGTIYSVDAAGPVPCRVTDATLLTAAVGDEEIAYNDAAGRTNPTATNLGAGQLGGLTVAPGLYKFSSNVGISSDVTLAGGADDVFIFQISGTLTQASATKVLLTGGVQAKNVFWQTTGGVAIGTTAHSEGTILSKTMIALNTGASTNGRLLAQTQVTLQKNVVTAPGL